MTVAIAQRNDPRLGIALMALTSFVFSAQDGLSRHLAEATNVYMVVMIRFWFFAGFVILLGRAQQGSIRAAAATSQPFVQIFRAVLLVAEICVTVYGFTLLGLAQSHALFAACPLIIAALSGPVLGEKVGWRRWAAIGVGFLGIVVILRPGVAVFDLAAVVPLIGAAMFALYSLLTRLVSRRDSAATSFFWTGVGGAVAMTFVGLPMWEPMSPADWAMMAVLCMTGVLGHWLLIKTYEVAEAAIVQPFAYLQLVFASAIGVTVFHETLHTTTVIGGGIVVAAGLFTLWRERVRRLKESA
ncbi:membrane protein [Rubellimicrobium mesophilum DSM 19309]|uniref:Membrane protein n=1 Tax=Rubellimicrobium mesophilum DSM 19309 TaxID=442562 RepID=A0A017HII4_9RHOB|nr:DMT family transporter [Rubellimicrobium mesophilum]EYD73963.1 membrane protein [Rubellimicrobium mesophilum DSM 19309]